MRSLAPKSILGQVRGALDRLFTLAAAKVNPRSSTDLEQRLAPGDVVRQAFLAAGRALIHVGRFDEADTALRRGLAAFPDDRDALIELAMSAHNGGRYLLAIERWTIALARAPEIAMCHAGLAANRRMIGDSQGATVLIEAALRRFPADLTIITEAARCAEQRGDFNAALDHWENAVNAAKPHPDWICGKARALTALGRLDTVHAGRVDTLKT